MIDQAKRIRELFKSELDKIKLSDTVGFAIEGPSYVPSQKGITMGWVAMVTLKHNILLGQDDIGVTVPIMGVLPPDDIFQKGAAYILDEARKLRHEMSTGNVSADGALEGNVIPPGLRPNGLSGSVSQRPPGAR